MNAMARVRMLAKEQKLRGVTFYDKNDKVGARGDAVVRVELEFSNKEIVNVTIQEMNMLKDVSFDLQRV